MSFDAFDNEELSELWGETEPAEKKAFENLPDGKYEAIVNSVRLDKVKNKKGEEKRVIAWDMIITELYPEAGKHVFHNQYIDTAQQVSFTKRTLEDLGLNITSLTSLQADLANLLDATLLITLKTKPATAEYEAKQNVYLNKVVAEAKRFNDEEIPF